VTQKVAKITKSHNLRVLADKSQLGTRQRPSPKK
jgi:hypothetical protein